MAHPGLELNILAGAVDGAIGNEKCLGGLVLRIVALAVPDAVEAMVGEPAIVTARDDQPLHLRRHALLVEDRLPVGVCELGELLGDNVETPLWQEARQALLLLEVFVAVAEELEVSLGHGFAGAGIGDKVEGLLVERLAHDGGVRDPDDDMRGVASRHLCA